MTQDETDRIINDERTFRLHIVETMARLEENHKACYRARVCNSEAIDKLKENQNKTIGGLIVLGALGIGAWIRQLFFGGS